MLVPQGILQLAVSGRNDLGIPRESRQEDLRAEFPMVAMGRRSAAWAEVSAARIRCAGRVELVGAGDCGIYAESVRHCGRREDAELFPVHRYDWPVCAGRAGPSLGSGAALLVAA